MVTFREMRIQHIVEDHDLGVEDKIRQLREIEDEARALQRAASEGPMNADDGWEADLREVRIALSRLGAREIRKGAASL